MKTMPPKLLRLGRALAGLATTAVHPSRGASWTTHRCVHPRPRRGFAVNRPASRLDWPGQDDVTLPGAVMMFRPVPYAGESSSIGFMSDTLLGAPW
jgi:hypothetical protein